eukprot:CAMPEP_0185260790 /NCGR_PEP_ID=MMETSP1359-20130426/9339_1 /TAXON_ID=552665 /ORGANISM="Bigelowiella longifila, Strain CCMP242" /LENGTH=92 /DNA_ID=CAMNT_0027847203 /DNA_START=15 /DNA_END=293 /DNA_ORIENTATION=+
MRDVHAISFILKQGCKVVVAVNKMDEASLDLDEYTAWLRSRTQGFFLSAGKLRVLELSAKRGWGVSELIDACRKQQQLALTTKGGNKNSSTY